MSRCGIRTGAGKVNLVLFAQQPSFNNAALHRAMFRANSKIAIKVSDDGVIRIGSLYLLLNSRCKVQASLASGTRRGKNFAGRSPQWLAAEKILFIQNLLYIVVMIIHIIAGKLLWI